MGGTYPDERLESPLTDPMSAPPLPTPRAVMRQLLFGHGVFVGSRVLILGDTRDGFVRYFDYLGIDVLSVDTAAKLQQQPEEPFRKPFDLILLRNFEAYRTSLFHPGAYETTGDLLSNVRPGGSLAFLDQAANLDETGKATARRPERHRESCIVEHFAAFPGQVHTWHPSDGFGLATTWNRLLRRPRPVYRIVSLRLPREAGLRDSDERRATRAANDDSPANSASETPVTSVDRPQESAANGVSGFARDGRDEPDSARPSVRPNPGAVRSGDCCDWAARMSDGSDSQQRAA